MNHEELIDKHFAGNLSAEETKQLMDAVEKHPHVAEEFKFQEELTTSIKVARKKELKATLASLPVPKMFNPTPLYIGAAAVVGLLFTGIYFLNPTEEPVSSSTVPAQEIVVIEEETTSATPEVVTEIDVQKEVISKEEINNAPDKIIEPKETKTISSTNNKGVNNQPKVTSQPTTPSNTKEYQYEIQEPVVKPGIAEYDDIHAETGIEAPGTNLTTTTKDNKVSEIVPRIEANNKSYRKYQYDGQNLTLIGDFNSEVPYVLYELKLDSEKQLYLKFEDKYYAIKNTGSRTNKLETLTDQVVINELENK